MSVELRAYQTDAIERLRASYRQGNRAPLLVMPTGSGKTVTFSYMAKSASAQGRRVLVLTHRTELLRQSSIALARFGVSHGLIMPGFHGEREQICVASVQTLSRRLKKQAMQFDLIIVDEAHLYIARTFRSVLAHFPKAFVLACTATPIRLDGRGLGIEDGGFCDDLVIGPTTQELIDMGHLARPVCFAPPSNIDLSGVTKSNGDYVASQLSDRVDKPAITGCAVEHYAKLSPGDPAIVFCASRIHAEHVAQEFNTAGFQFAVVHGGLDPLERAKRLQDFSEGRLQGITSVDLLTTGTDIPRASTAILLRPTASLSYYLQSVGRILRPSPSKHRALILDHVGSCLKFGLVEENRDWSLTGVKKKPRQSDDDDLTVRQCKACFSVWERGPQCPNCGAVAETKPRRVVERDGELRQITKDEIERVRKARRSEVGRAQSRDELAKIARERGYASGWVDIQMNLRRRRG